MLSCFKLLTTQHSFNYSIKSSNVLYFHCGRPFFITQHYLKHCRTNLIYIAQLAKLLYTFMRLVQNQSFSFKLPTSFPPGASISKSSCTENRYRHPTHSFLSSSSTTHPLSFSRCSLSPSSSYFPLFGH